MKIIDKLNSTDEIGYSIEFFPPKTEIGVENQNNRVQRFAKKDPTFVDLTWGAGGSTSELTLALSQKWQQEYGVDVNMHLTCTNMLPEKVDQALAAAKEAGIQNIVALRGDPPLGQEKWTVTDGGFSCALDLVKYIRQQYGDYFCIAVAGYPEGHPEVIKEVNESEVLKDDEKGRAGKWGVCRTTAYQAELAYLKQKIEAGADLIITQLFYDVELFLKFVADCREIGIECPILPGIMLIQNYAGFHKMTQFCKTRVPQEIYQQLEKIKDEPEAVARYGKELGWEMCLQLIRAGVKTLHLYTLNKDQPAMTIIDNLTTFKANQNTKKQKTK